MLLRSRRDDLEGVSRQRDRRCLVLQVAGLPQSTYQSNHEQHIAPEFAALAAYVAWRPCFPAGHAILRGAKTQTLCVKKSLKFYRYLSIEPCMHLPRSRALRDTNYFYWGPRGTRGILKSVPHGRTASSLHIPGVGKGLIDYNELLFRKRIKIAFRWKKVGVFEDGCYS